MSLKETLNFLFSLRGRVPRCALWLHLLSLIPLWFLLIALSYIADLPFIPAAISYVVRKALLDILFYGWLLSHWAFIIKRLHDLNMSGWLLLVMISCDIACAVIYKFALVSAVVLILLIVAELFPIYMRLRLYLVAGTPGANSYGRPSALMRRI